MKKIFFYLLFVSFALISKAQSKKVINVQSTANLATKEKVQSDSTVLATAINNKVGTLYDSVQVTTTNNTATTAATLVLSSAEISTIEVCALALLSDGNGSFNAKKTRTFLKNTAGSLNNGALQTVESDQYLGTGLTTATFTITNSGNDVIIQATGEAGKTINWKLIIKRIKK